LKKKLTCLPTLKHIVLELRHRADTDTEGGRRIIIDLYMEKADNAQNNASRRDDGSEVRSAAGLLH